MVTAADARTRLVQRPFTPFRIMTSSGQGYDVMHPEFVMVGKRIVVIGKPAHQGDLEFDQVELVSIMHITAFELLPPATVGRRRR